MNFHPHRVQPAQFDEMTNSLLEADYDRFHAPLAVEMPREPISRRQLAINTYSVYRKAGHGVRASLRQFFRVLRGNT